MTAASMAEADWTMLCWTKEVKEVAQHMDTSFYCEQYERALECFEN